MSKKKTKEEFIAEANKVHNGIYDYSKVQYKDNKTKVIIICPEHGEFWQTPYKHLSGQGCPFCRHNKKSNTNEFIKKANNVHGRGKYDYSKVHYINNTTPVCIICPKHGEFFQDPHNHLRGKGCPECGKEVNKPKKYTAKTFIEACVEIHGDKYDYSQTTYENAKEKVKIICPEHGEFYQYPYLHLRGSGCPKCATSFNGVSRRLTLKEFIERGKELHQGKYDYSKVKYVTAKEKVCIICPKHGEFWQAPEKHLIGCGCPKCVQPYSKSEKEISDYIKSLIGEGKVIEHDRNILAGKELDIYIPTLGFAIEFNGLYWHNKEKNYHKEKTDKCREKDIRLLQIFEDEYTAHKEIVLSKIRHILGKCDDYPKIMARKCIIKEVDRFDAKKFLEKNHIQGYGSSTMHLGAFFNGGLVAIMSFKKESSKEDWELTRFASKIDVVCQGIGGKLFNYFIKNYKVNSVKSFADRRWTTDEKNNLYTKLGFTFEKYTPIDYRYYKPQDGPVRQHKFGFRKKILNKKYGLPLTMTESQMAEELGYQKIYDCGLIKYVWRK